MSATDVQDSNVGAILLTCVITDRKVLQHTAMEYLHLSQILLNSASSISGKMAQMLLRRGCNLTGSSGVVPSLPVTVDWAITLDPRSGNFRIKNTSRENFSH